MTNQPQKIYLNLGFDRDEEPNPEFSTLIGVTWHTKRIHENDIEYARLDERLISTLSRIAAKAYTIAKGTELGDVAREAAKICDDLGIIY